MRRDSNTHPVTSLTILPGSPLLSAPCIVFELCVPVSSFFPLVDLIMPLPHTAVASIRRSVAARRPRSRLGHCIFHLRGPSPSAWASNPLPEDSRMSPHYSGIKHKTSSRKFTVIKPLRPSDSSSTHSPERLVQPNIVHPSTPLRCLSVCTLPSSRSTPPISHP